MNIEKADFIDDKVIREHLAKGNELAKDKNYIEGLIEKASKAHGLTIDEVSIIFLPSK